MQIIKFDVVTDLWNLADIKGTIFLLKVIGNFLPSLELVEYWLAITNYFLSIESLIDADTYGLVVIDPIRVYGNVVFFLLQLFNYLVSPRLFFIAFEVRTEPVMLVCFHTAQKLLLSRVEIIHFIVSFVRFAVFLAA